MTEHRAMTWGQIFSATMAAVCLAGGLAIGYVQWTNRAAAYEIVNPEAHYARQVDTNVIEVYREFRIVRAGTFHFDREIGRVDPREKIARNVELPDSEGFLQAGVHRRSLLMVVPPLAPGRYEFINRVCWPSNIFRLDCLDLPRLPFELKEIQ